MTATLPTDAVAPSPDWEHFAALSPRDKGRQLVDADGRLRGLLYAQQFTRPLLEHLVALAEVIRGRRDDEAFGRALKRTLATRSGALYFTQPSTRTYTSFSLAARATGMMCEEIRDREMSSLYKGESELDTLLTLAELADAIIMRQGDHSLIDRFAWEAARRGYPTRILNGGSGSDQHPTQALLELSTIAAHLDLAGGAPITVGIVGDLKRSRTARSLSYLLALWPQVRHVFIAPDELQMADDLTGYLDDAGVAWARTESLEDALPELDVVYMMRIQDEYGDTSETLRSKYSAYRLTPERLRAARPGAIVLHPLPRRDELPIEIDDDPRARYWEAVDRGKFVRIALLLHMFGKDDPDALIAAARG